MNKHLVYFNEEYLPSVREPQICVYLCTPSIGLWFLDSPICIGFREGREHVKFSFIILGFGIEYNKNWDL